MKPGSSGDPFDEDEDEDNPFDQGGPADEGDSSSGDEPQPNSVPSQNGQSMVEEIDGTQESVSTDRDPATTQPQDSQASSSSPRELAEQYTPKDYDLSHAWALGRSTVKDGRPKEKTFFLQSQIVEESGSLESQASDEVEEILGGSVSTTDLREAALIIGYSNPDLLAELLSEWGAELA